MKYISQRTGLYVDLNLGEKLGKGVSGKVYQLLDNNNVATNFVCKYIEIKPLPQVNQTRKEVLRSTINEIHALKKMDLLEGYFRNGNEFCIIMKKIKGTYPNIDDIESAQPSFNAMRDCHRKNIAHFDTHTRNFLQRVKKNQQIKSTAIDFGLSQNATFFNIFLDSFFYLGRQLKEPDYRAFLRKLFMQDLLHYIKNNIVEALMTITWWSLLIYGTLYGIPAFNLPHQYFYEYLKAKLYYQAFLELRSVGLIYDIFAKLLLKHFIDNETLYKKFVDNPFKPFKYIFKPFYLLGLYFPYTHLKDFWQIITQGNHSIPHIPVTASPGIFSCFQTALLYYPLKAGVEFIQDTVIHPLEPEALTLAKADLHFQYHPMLYIKAAMHSPERNTLRKLNITKW